jgi:hypothetical protein
MYPFDWTSVDCGGGHLTGTNGAFDLYTNQNVESKDFKFTGYNVHQVAADGISVCAINAGSEIFCADNTMNFKKLPNLFAHVTVSGTKVYAVDASGAIWYTADWTNFNGWTQILGQLTQIDFDGETLCGVTSDGSVNCANSGLESSPNWQVAPMFGAKTDSRLYSYVSVLKGSVVATTKGGMTYSISFA